MLQNGYIKLYRNLLNWEWYDDINTKTLFLHLLLTVNYEPQKWRGITIEIGQRVSSYAKLSKETGLSVQSVRTCINRLKSTGELTHQTTNEYGIFTINNFDKFQMLTDQPTVEQQPVNSQPTVDQQQRKKANKAKKEKEYICRDEKIPYSEIISYLNSKAGKSYRPADSHREHIRARWNEGFRLEDFKKVIDTKCKDWNKEPRPGERDMRQYLRPSTLFGTKFQDYLNQGGDLKDAGVSANYSRNEL